MDENDNPKNKTEVVKNYFRILKISYNEIIILNKFLTELGLVLV
jgi:hypothetical protein